MTLLIKKVTGRDFIREQVRLRDNFTCQKCGFMRNRKEVEKHNKNTGTKLKGKIKSLDIHHLNGLCGKLSKAYDRKKDIDGLITLCHSCHYNLNEHRCKSKEFKKQRELMFAKGGKLEFLWANEKFRAFHRKQQRKGFKLRALTLSSRSCVTVLRG